MATRSRLRRKLLVATAGLATVSYVTCNSRPAKSGGQDEVVMAQEEGGGQVVAGDGGAGGQSSDEGGAGGAANQMAEPEPMPIEEMPPGNLPAPPPHGGCCGRP